MSVLKACDGREDTSGVSEQQGGVFKPKPMGSTVRSMNIFETSSSSPGNSLISPVTATTDLMDAKM